MTSDDGVQPEDPDEAEFPTWKKEGLPDPLAEGDVDHLAATKESDDAATRLVRSGLFLIGWLIEQAPGPWAITCSNDFAAIACFARSFRQVRAATLLAHFGYYTEVPTVLRAAYEAGGVGRYLAHNPDKADKWIEKTTWSPDSAEGWVPDRKVREWFGDTDERAYSAIYGVLSKGAHPTAASCIPALKIDEDGYLPRIRTEYEEDAFQESLMEILGVTLWLCFALKNAVANPDLIRPDWTHAVADYANEVADLIGERVGVRPDFSHLQKDWDAEYAKYEAILKRVSVGAEARDMVARHQEKLRRQVADVDG